MDTVKDIDGAYIDTDMDVIGYEGGNYYGACNAFVANLREGGQSFCVKRKNHPQPNLHEDYDGRQTIDPTDPQSIAKGLVAQYWNSIHRDQLLSGADIYVVWFTFTLGNWKALLSSSKWEDTSYFEVTFNKEKLEAYIDHYTKQANVVAHMEKTN